jgi:hypothetical protein
MWEGGSHRIWTTEHGEMLTVAGLEMAGHGRETVALRNIRIPGKTKPICKSCGRC